MRRDLGFITQATAVLFAAATASIHVRAEQDRSVFLYGGPSTTAPLLEIVKASVPRVEKYSIISAGLSRKLASLSAELDLEGENTISKHLEKAELFSFTLGMGLRWKKPPWHRTAGGSFIFGHGISYATGIPEVEAMMMNKTSRWLYHLYFEFDFTLGKGSPWRAFFRDHHRSGVFGLFDGAVGGSDFLCLGLKYLF